MTEPRERRVEEAERLARMEEQVRGMREDFNKFQGYMTETVTAFMATISNMHRDFIPRSENVTELALRDNEIKTLKKEVQELKLEQKELKARPTWHSVLIGALVGSISLGFFELLMKK